jgi:hypothetical protein
LRSLGGLSFPIETLAPLDRVFGGVEGADGPDLKQASLGFG